MLPAPALPTTLGEFRLDRVLGQGGSGTVYDASWGPRRVALKVLNAGIVGTDRERAQFLAEAQRLQQIGHPSVVKVLAAGELPDGRPYLAMERLDGETLASVIARSALPLAHAIELFGELSSAVGALHDQGLVHRDLKPENVFVVAGRHAVLLDFGIAKDLAAPASTTTQEGNVRGTPAYMAPERFFGQPAGIATDVYELALILYAMLAGRLPWDEIADPEARLSPRPLVELAHVPEALDVEIRRALSTRVQNRPASASALCAAIRAAALGDPGEPDAAETARLRAGKVKPPDQATPLAWAPTMAAESTKSPRKRWPWVGAGLAVAAAVATFAYVRQGTPKPATVAVVPAAAVTRPTPAPIEPVTSPPSSGNDPWAVAPPEPTPMLPLTGSRKSTAAYRTDAAAAIRRLPRDTGFLFAVQLGELRSRATTANVLDKVAGFPKVKMLGALVPECVRAMAANAEWAVFGAASIDAAVERGTLIVSGRWSKQDVVACLHEKVEVRVAKDGTALYKVGSLGWVDFIDDHTAYATIGEDLDVDELHTRVRRANAGPARLAAGLATLPEARSIAIAVNGHAGIDWSSLLAVPSTSDIVGWMRVDPLGMTIDVAADVHDEAVAKTSAAAAEARVHPPDATDETLAALTKLAVVREKTVVHVRGTLSWPAVSLLTSSLSL